MRSMFASFRAQREQDRRARRYRELIRREADIGGKLFGPIPAGGRREFFCLDEHTWVWHEEWTDAAGKRQAITTRYDVRQNGIFKAQDGQPYCPLTIAEVRNLKQAAVLYNEKVRQAVYGLSS
ncbi:MAG: hypothetical protein ACREGD_04225 [Candidatus Saccharimonadales bacterium]